jgi:ABC-2 type transport system ATP-binding protein
MVLGLTSPTSDTIEVYGATPHRAVVDGRVSAVMQTGGLLPDFTVRETIRAIAALHGRPERVDVVVESAGLGPLANRLVKTCSGGEQQRLKFALALVPDPNLVILDEPTTGMDVSARQHLWDTMRADAADGRTIVFATHYLAVADAFADRTVLMARGRIMADGPTAEVRAQSEILLLALGSPVAVIAARAHLSIGTVRNHLSAAIGKTGASTRAEAARLAESNGGSDRIQRASSRVIPPIGSGASLSCR